jgi:hypothetical protein
MDLFLSISGTASISRGPGGFGITYHLLIVFLRSTRIAAALANDRLEGLLKFLQSA